MDIVPYITEVNTLLGRNAGEEVARSALGYYSVYAGETITISGYNLKNGETAPTLNLSGSSNANVISVDNSSVEAITATIGASAVSGELYVSVNGVKSLNNANVNPTFADGATEASGGYMANSWANSVNNKRLTDDIKLYIWNNGFFKESVKIYAPNMKMDDDGNYYMIYDNNINQATQAFQLAFNKNGSTYYLDGSYNKFHNTALVVTGGNAYGVATNTDRVGDTSARFKYYPWSNNTTAYAQTRYQFDALTRDSNWRYGQGYSLEQAYNSETGVYEINRVPTPKMAVDTSGNIYMSYFDNNHTQHPVKFRCNGGTSDGLTQTTNGTAQSGSNVTTSTGTAKNFHVVADDTMTYKGGKYSAVGATSGGVAVVAWYDASKRQLVYSYNTAPGTPVYGDVWQTNAQVIDDSYAGQYVDLFVDSEDGIHIAYYVNSTGDLKYAYLPSYNFKLTEDNRDNYVVTVDAYLSAGTNITINTKDETVDGTTYIVPYIAYQNASFIQTTSPIRVAWLPKKIVKGTASTVSAGANGNFFTGIWEVVAVPTTNIPTDSLVCSGVPTGDDAGLGHEGKSPVLGFMSDSGYESAFIKY